jgi:hypothetical protein
MFGIYSFYNNFIQDAAPGDSGAPLYTLGDNATSGEISGQYLIGIHSGGKDEFVATRLQRGNVFFPKWWIRVSVNYSKKINQSLYSVSHYFIAPSFLLEIRLIIKILSHPWYPLI